MPGARSQEEQCRGVEGLGSPSIHRGDTPRHSGHGRGGKARPTASTFASAFAANAATADRAATVDEKATADRGRAWQVVSPARPGFVLRSAVV